MPTETINNDSDGSEPLRVLAASVQGLSVVASESLRGISITISISNIPATKVHNQFNINLCYVDGMHKCLHSKNSLPKNMKCTVIAFDKQPLHSPQI
eukprot:4966615-Amphidinium_carterae.1